MIIKSSSSEVFDIFSENMLRKEAGQYEYILKALKAGGVALNALLPAGMKLDDFIVDIIKSGAITADEMAQLLGRNPQEIKALVDASNVAGEAAANAAKIVPDAAKALSTSGLPQEIVNATQELRKHSNALVSIIKDVKNKNTPELAKQALEQLESSKEALLAQIKLAKELSKTAESSTELTELLSRSRAASDLIRRAQSSVDILEEVASAAKLLPGAINAAEEVTKELAVKGIYLSKANQKLLEDAVEKTELAEYYKTLAKALTDAGEGNSLAGKAASKIAEDTSKSAKDAVAKIAAGTPEALATINKALAKASSDGAQTAAKDTAQAAAKDTADSIPGKAIAPDQTTVPGKTSIERLKELVTTHKPDVVNGAKSLGRGAAGIAGSAMGAATGTFGLKLLGFAAITGLGVGSLLAWRRWSTKNQIISTENIKSLKVAQYDSIRNLRTLSFKNGSKGDQLNRQLLEALEASFRTLGSLESEGLSKMQFDQAMMDLDRVALLANNFISSKDSIKDDLNEGSLDSAILSLSKMMDKSGEFKGIMIRAIQERESLPQDAVEKEQDRVPEGRLKEDNETTKDDESHIPQYLDILGEQIDIGHLGRGMRSAAPRMMKKVLLTPEGLAFVDPQNIWGGWLNKTTMKDGEGNVVQNKQADFLKALKYLYLNQIFNRNQLRTFVKQNLPRVGKRRLSGWKDAVSFYKRNLNKFANNTLNNFFTQKLFKPANSKESSVNSKVISNYTTKDSKDMLDKKADKSSKEFYQTIVKELNDQYAQDYFDGLKGMHETKPERTKADHQKLYNTQFDAGAELIGKAHPHTIEVAESHGKGGVIENQVEQQRAFVEVIRKMPSGNFKGNYAWVVNDLVKLADETDRLSNEEASNLIDKAIKELNDI